MATASVSTPTSTRASSPDATLKSSGPEGLGLRERKKRETFEALHRAAVDLAVEQGYTAVTTEAIAARAGVSARTFFNYFPAKQDAIIGAQPADLDAAVDLIASAHRDAPLLPLVRRAVELVLVPSNVDPQLRRRRRTLLFAEPSLAGAIFSSTVHVEDRLVEAVEAHLGVPHGQTLRPRLVVVTTMGAVRAAMRLCHGEIHDPRFTAAVDEAFTLLAAGLD